MSDSVQPHKWQPTRLSRPWDSPGKNTGVDCHFLLQVMKVKSESEVAQSCLTFHNPMDCSLPGSSVHGIFQARVLEWGAIAFSAQNPYLVANKEYFEFNLRYVHYPQLDLIFQKMRITYFKGIKRNLLNSRVSVPAMLRKGVVVNECLCCTFVSSGCLNKIPQTE